MLVFIFLSCFLAAHKISNFIFGKSCPNLVGCPSQWAKPNQSILKEISPGISLEGMMLKLKLQYFGHLM